MVYYTSENPLAQFKQDIKSILPTLHIIEKKEHAHAKNCHICMEKSCLIATKEHNNMICIKEVVEIEKNTLNINRYDHLVHRDYLKPLVHILK